MNAPIKKSAQLRAAILEICKRAPDSLISTEFITHPLITALELQDNTVQVALRDMTKAKNPLIQRIRISRPDNPQARYAYELADPGKTPYATIGEPKKPSSLPPDLKLDVVKGSGKLRLEYKGLRIEIGVVE